MLETEFETAGGTVALIDFMPLRGPCSDLIRIIEARRGRVSMRSELVIRFDYGSFIPWVRRLDDTTLEAIAGPDRLVLRSDVPMRGENMRTVSEFTVARFKDFGAADTNDDEVLTATEIDATARKK